MSKSLKDRIAVIGMGCTRFGERWDRSAEDLMIDAASDAIASVPGLRKDDIEAYWVATLASGHSGLMLSRALKVDRPVTRVENFCASGSEAFRNAAFAVAAGVYDVAMAVGVEKLKDSGYSGLTLNAPPGDNTSAEISNPARAARRRATAVLEQVGLGERMHHYPSELSGGEQQRVAIARALATGNPILVADEPTGDLDFQTGVQVLQLLEEQAAGGHTVIVVTHNREISRIADRAVELSSGQIVSDGPPRGGRAPINELRW